MTGNSEKPQLWEGALFAPNLDELVALSEMSRDEMQDRRDELAEIVPKRQYGDGIETYDDFILPQHAATSGQARAAKELYWLRSHLGEIEPRFPSEDTGFFCKGCPRGTQISA